MLRLLGLMISIGLADSINPSTIAPALYLSAGNHGRRQVTLFTLSVFAVNLAAGALIAIGPGQIIRNIADIDVQQTIRHVAELVVGGVLITAGVILWRRREQLAKRRLPQPKQRGRSSALLGAGITAAELPTAFPYFAAIAAIVGSGVGLARQLILLLLFNICFVLPLVGILLTLWVAPSHAQERLSRARLFLHRHWPRLLGGLMLLVGVFVVLLGATGLAGHAHGRVARFFRHVHKLLPP